MRDINALSAPISRITTLRDDEGRSGFTLIELLVVFINRCLAFLQTSLMRANFYSSARNVLKIPGARFDACPGEVTTNCLGSFRLTSLAAGKYFGAGTTSA